MLLENKSVIITGVGPGMGCKLAREAARAGANVTMMARRPDLMATIAAEVAAAGGEALAVTGDVTVPADCANVAAAAIARFGRIDALINSAYYAGVMAPVLEADLDDWRRGFEVTLFGAINMIRAVAPDMIARRAGAIVNIGTMETRRPLAGNGQYNVPKSALQGLTRQLATELGQHNIRVNSAIPGWMWGDPVKDYFERHSVETGVPVETLMAHTAAMSPLNRIPRDEECAKAVLMLASDYCLEVTGATFDINGGAIFPS